MPKFQTILIMLSLFSLGSGALARFAPPDPEQPGLFLPVIQSPSHAPAPLEPTPIASGTPAPTPSVSPTATPQGAPTATPTVPPTQPPPGRLPRVHVPYMDDFARTEAAIFWFGQVTDTQNYADVRLGYTDQALFVRLAAFDRHVWYDTQPERSDLESWDAATLLIDLNPAPGELSSSTYRFVGQLDWWEGRANYQAAYQGNGTGWGAANIAFQTSTGMRGPLRNDNAESDRGWEITYEIPFSSLGLSQAPAQGTQWRLGMILHDRDQAAGDPLPAQLWPSGAQAASPATWGELSFGLLPAAAPAGTPAGTVEIRQGLNGATVVDAPAGGGTMCGYGLDYWSEWGLENYAGVGYFNIQNQADVADWPCYSKLYITFPLDSLPDGKVVLNAALTLYEFGGSDPTKAKPSLIQIMTVAQDWQEGSLNWNNGPQMLENVSQTWVTPLPQYPGWNGVPFAWDLTHAVAQARQAGQPLRLVIYSADSAYHSGKYFYTSEAENPLARPKLTITWGEG